MRNLVTRIAIPFLLIVSVAASFSFENRVNKETKSEIQKTTQKQTQRPVKIHQVVFLDSKNTSIGFLGKHAGKKPRPRTGGFKNFSGYILFDDHANKLSRIKIEIDIRSIWTEFSSLTSHLLGGEFFESESFPYAVFESDTIEHLSDEEVRIDGKLSLHGITKSISMLAKVDFGNGNFVLTSNFQLSRSNFGFNQMKGGVADQVEVSVKIGDPTKHVVEKEGNGSESSKPSAELELPKEMKDRKVVKVLLPNML